MCVCVLRRCGPGREGMGAILAVQLFPSTIKECHSHIKITANSKADDHPCWRRNELVP